MNTETHRQLAGFIWSICNLLRGPYKRNEYRYEPPRELAVIEGEIKALEADIVRLLGEVTA